MDAVWGLVQGIGASQRVGDIRRQTEVPVKWRLCPESVRLSVVF